MIPDQTQTLKLAQQPANIHNFRFFFQIYIR